MALNYSAIADANADEPWPGWGVQIPGVHWYYFGGGAGADPAYNGTSSEAISWGYSQAAAAFTAINNLYGAGHGSATTHRNMVFFDVESDPSWQVQVNCNKVTIGPAVSSSLDIDVVYGFYDWMLLAQHNGYNLQPGVYSSPGWWNPIMSPYQSIPTFYAWTSETDSGAVSPSPVGWTQGSYSASWFGSVQSNYQLGWQFDSGSNDYDQFDAGNFP